VIIPIKFNVPNEYFLVDQLDTLTSLSDEKGKMKKLTVNPANI